MSRRARLLRALARYCARVHRAERTADGWHPLGPWCPVGDGRRCVVGEERG